MLNVHNFLIVCIQFTLFVKECIQSIYINFQRMYTILHICKQFFKKSIQSCIFKVTNFQFYTFNVSNFLKNEHNSIVHLTYTNFQFCAFNAHNL